MVFSAQSIQEIIKQYYDLDGEVQALAGYVDINFLIRGTDGSKYLLKVCRPEISQEAVDFQVALMDHLNAERLDFEVPRVIRNKSNNASFLYAANQKTYSIRLHSWVEGRVLADVNPRTEPLYHSWGKTCGQLSRALQGFDHAGAHRFDEWNPMEALHSKRYYEYLDSEEKKEVADYYWRYFEESQSANIDLRMGVNYGDAHEHNLIVSRAKISEKVTGVIDFGDAIYAPIICELAIACAYAGMFVPDPLRAMCAVVKGYQEAFPLDEEELVMLFPLICGRLLTSMFSAAYKFHLDPSNDYHQISAKPAWDLLQKLRMISYDLVHYSFRNACGFEAFPEAERIRTWLGDNPQLFTAPVLLDKSSLCSMDLSVGSMSLGNNSNYENTVKFNKRITDILHECESDIGIGGYGEIRPFYTTDAYKVEGNNGPQWRTMHLGIDYWTSDGNEVLAMADGEVFSVFNNDNPCDYGPTIILRHTFREFSFFSLYGHLSLTSLAQVVVGQKVSKGEVIAWVGADNENGGWPPHLHHQLILDMLGNEVDFPGVAFVEESDVWMSLCPVYLPPNTLLPMKNQDLPQLVAKRGRMLGRSLSVSYDEPLHIVRGYGSYLYDVNGRRYLDTVNNVAHVGHEHHRVVRAAQRQMGVLNTNTRYLNANIVEYAEDLLARCPEPLEVVYFVNSGSEANELALRMAKTYTGQKDVVALETGYHGNTGGCIDISSYKFDGKGGQGAPEFTSICPMPDLYRGAYKSPDTAGSLYAKAVEAAILSVKEKGRGIACFIAESILSCGGQIVLPEGYLQACYRYVRAEDALCIADEVQVGFGRVGKHFWAFEMQGVVPDIVTCGKPIGNGHPLAAVITTRKIAEAFENGMEYFNTFGGNPVSCAIGKEVLQVLKDESMQENAERVGAYLLDGLRGLMDTHTIIGDVRGQGLFLGFELVKDRSTLEPAPKEAHYLINRMRELGILMSTDGPLYNVIKIKPPMCFSMSQADELLMRLNQVFHEDFMKV